MVSHTSPVHESTFRSAIFLETVVGSPQCEKHKVQDPEISPESSLGDAAFSRVENEHSISSRRGAMSHASLSQWSESSLVHAFVHMPENPFADAEPSGETPSSAKLEDPMEDIIKYSHVVTAEHKPIIARLSGISGACAERAEIVDPSRALPGPARIPRATFSQAKAFFLKSSASGDDLQGIISRRTPSQDHLIMTQDEVANILP